MKNKTRHIAKVAFGMLLATSCNTASAQTNNVGIGTNSPDASAILELQATDKGILIPRTDTNLVIAPATGLLIYETADNTFYYFDGTYWVAFGGGGMGPAGPTGPTGAGVPGPTGPTGTGVAGPTGPTGTGVAGPTGPTGTGVAGPTGPSGPVGCGSANYVIKSNGSSATCTIIYDDGASVGIAKVPGGFMLGGPATEIYHPLEVGNDAGTNSQATIGYWWASDVALMPETAGGWSGYVGFADLTNFNDWFEGYAQSWWNTSQRSRKRDIVTIDNSKALSEYVIGDIDDIKPSFYKFKGMPDEMLPGSELRYRPQMHLGIIADESPDYVLNGTFTAVSGYSLATLGIFGVKYNRAEIQEIKEVIGMGNAIIVQDFGSTQLNSTELVVKYSEEFSTKMSVGNLPVVTVTSNNPSVVLSVTEKDKDGFKVVASKSTANLTFDWMAIMKVKSVGFEDKSSERVPADLLPKLKVPDETKEKIQKFHKTLKPTKTKNGL
ncbi:MAG TPA: hypothetical protein EYN71_06915 [Flavobacteriales bacterium]|nr:hypothetical protein [Flavobacteriales bacterium]